MELFFLSDEVRTWNFWDSSCFQNMLMQPQISSVTLHPTDFSQTFNGKLFKVILYTSMVEFS